MNKECCNIKVAELENGYRIEITGEGIKEKCDSCCTEENIKKCFQSCCGSKE